MLVHTPSFDPDACLGYDEQAMNVTLPHPSSPSTHYKRNIISPLTKTTTTTTPPTPPPPNVDDDDKTYTNMLRKASVAVAGTALIGAGIPLIPLPGPGDFMVVGGLALLATEFPAAQRVIDKGRDKLVQIVGDDDDDEDEDEEDGDGEIREQQERQRRHDPLLSSSIHHNINSSLSTPPSSWSLSPAEHVSKTTNNGTSTSSYRPMNQPNTNTNTSTTTSTSSDIDDAIARAGVEVNKAMKQTSKSLKKFTKNVIIPMMNHIATNNNDTEAGVGGETELSTITTTTTSRNRELSNEVTVRVTNRSSDDDRKGTTTTTNVIFP